MFICCLRDIVADRFLPRLLLERDLKSACRGFVDAVSYVNGSGDDLLVKHPEHFELWQVGFFDEDNGDIDPYPACVMTGRHAVQAIKNKVDVTDIDFDELWKTDASEVEDLPHDFREEF